MKKGVLVFGFILIIILLVSSVYAFSWSDFWAKITGKFTAPTTGQVTQSQNLYTSSGDIYSTDSYKKLYQEKISKLSNSDIKGLAKAKNAGKNIDSLLQKYEIPKETDTEINSINKKAGTWKANYNPIMLKPEEQKKKLLGLKLSEGQEEKLKSKITGNAVFSSSSSQLPDFFDWRNVSGKNYITPIKDQAGCGSCWAFAIVGAQEGEANTYYNNPNLDADLSEQDLVSCSGAGSCGGGWPETALSYIQESGIADENCFPYTATDQDCSNKCSNWQEEAWKISSYENIELGNIEAIKNALIEKGPIVTGMAVYDDFFSYSEGIYSHTSDWLAGYHAIVIVGYGIYDGQTYWIVKNSWGTEWGENGYFKIFAGDSNIDTFLLHAISSPIPPVEQEKLCTDDDADNYCYWGLGIKPDNCLSSCANNSIEDCDDSNSAIYQGCGKSSEKLGKLQLTSSPSEADVYVADLSIGNYIYRGKTPLLIDLAIGERSIKISKADYDDYLTNVSISEGGTAELNVLLVKVPKLTYPMNNDIFRAGDSIQIKGIAPSRADLKFLNYSIEYGIGENPNTWYTSGINLKNSGKLPVENGTLATWDTISITKANFYTLRLSVNYAGKQGKQVYSRNIYLDTTLKKGWPQKIEYESGYSDYGAITTADLYATIPKKNSKIGGASKIELISTMPISPSINNLKKIYLSSVSGEYFYYWAGFLEPVVSDINKDGFKEIIVFKGGNPPKILVYKHDGSLYWQADFGKFIQNEGVAGGNLHIPLIGDLDNDNYDEIVAFNYNTTNDVPSELYAFNHDGSLLWMTGVPKEVHPTMLMADLNNDGNKEIFIKGNDAWNRSMTIVSNKGKIISQWYVHRVNWGASIVGSPAVGNFDNDSDFEIVSAGPSEGAGGIWDGDKFLGWNNTGIIYVYNLDGSVVNGWPVSTNGVIFSSPVVADINKDGQQEIILGLMYASDIFPEPELGGLYAFDRDGKILPGFPFEKGWNFWSTPALADIDNEGDLEISASKIGFVTYLLYHDGTIVSGWPQDTTWNDYYSSIIGDITSNNNLDVLTAAGCGFYPSISEHGGVYAWNSNGSKINGFPKVTEVDAQAPAVIDDIDKDGKLELVASSDWDYDTINNIDKNRGSIYVWELSGNYNKLNMPWPTFMHDSQHTGCYDCEKKFEQKLNLTCQKEYYKNWHLTRCNARLCGKDKYVKCETKKISNRNYYREVCAKTYSTSCLANSSCGSDKEITRQKC